MSLLDHSSWVHSRETPAQRKEYFDTIVANRLAQVLVATTTSEARGEDTNNITHTTVAANAGKASVTAVVSKPQNKGAKPITAEKRLRELFGDSRVVVSPTHEPQTFAIPEDVEAGLPRLLVPARVAQRVSLEMRAKSISEGQQS